MQRRDATRKRWGVDVSAEGSTLVIEPLGSKHNRAAFSCGTSALDSYLHKQAAQDQKKKVAAVFVITPDGETIAGFYTLSQYAVELDSVPPELAKRLPKYPMVPATILGRLAVDTKFQGQGLGETLLMNALSRTLRVSGDAASAAMVVDAKDGTAVAFYKKYGFVELPNVEKRLFLPMATIAAMFPE